MPYVMGALYVFVRALTFRDNQSPVQRRVCFSCDLCAVALIVAATLHYMGML